jgi:O-methyltransferase
MRGSTGDWIREIRAVARAQRDLQKQLAASVPSMSLPALMKRFRAISENVECPHDQSHLLMYSRDLLALDPDIPGDIVEAGAFKGGSTAKTSIIAMLLNRKMLVFDSFQGLPENEELHDESILGHSIEGWFETGKFHGTLDEVRRNVGEYGEIDVCEFIPGWFDDTMPGLDRDLCAVYLDVDLASSTRTCLKFLYPQIVPGGLLYSQDGDFPRVIEVFEDNQFWEQEVGCERPTIEGLGTSKILKIVKR